MEALHLSEAESFRQIQRVARDRNLRLADVAWQIEQRSVLLDIASDEAPRGLRDQIA